MKYISFISLVLCALSVTHGAAASETNGTITTGFHTTNVCHSVNCGTPTPGTINLKPTGTTAVTIDDSAMNGIAWGNELGWITFNPTGPEGVTVNAQTGTLSGKAWSQVGGWINFAPTGQSVTITARGQFSGWAWVSGPFGGWVKFDCTSVATCIKTDWRPMGARTQGGSSNGPVPVDGGGGNSPSDMCWNISGVQFEIPVGMIRTSESICEQPQVDVCQNISGNQSRIPYGYTGDESGLCFLVVDYCPNISDAQYAVPIGYVVTNAGICVKSATPIIPPVVIGERVSLPVGTNLLQSGDIDVTSAVAHSSKEIAQGIDVCTNLPEVQSAIPVGYVTDYLGACVPETVDYCPNIIGPQRSIPMGMVVTESGFCAEVNKNIVEKTETLLGAGEADDSVQDVVAFHFVPKDFVMPVHSVTLTKIFRALTPGEGTTAFIQDERPHDSAAPIDILSLATGMLGLTSIIVSAWYLSPLLFALFFVRHWGVVFNATTGEALAHARILLYDSAGTVVTEMLTTDAGKYGFHVKKGTYRIRAVVDGFMLDPEAHGAALYDGGEVIVGNSGRLILNIAMRAVSNGGQ